MAAAPVALVLALAAGAQAALNLPKIIRLPNINPAVDEIKSWGRLSFATGSTLEKVDRNVRLMTSGPLLSTVQRSPLFEDCKTFVDMPMRFDPEEVLANFRELSSSPTEDELREFIEHNFLEAGIDLQHSEPVDFNPDPAFARRIPDAGLREFGYYIHSIWPQLFRRVDPDARMHQQRHSLLALPYPLVVPGGRFRESYYWDTYWIVEGLLVSGMHQSVRGIIKNLLSYIESFGFVPNGGRCYYMDRSQPPMLSEMVRAYYEATGDVALLRHALPLLDREYDFWMAEPGSGTQSHAVTLEDAAGNKHVLNKFMSKEATPRPESYREDLELVAGLDGRAASELWCDIRAAAESGWDFSSRWMADGRTLGTTRTRDLLPVGLNSLMLRFERNMAKLYAVLAQEDMTAAIDLTHSVARYTAAKEARKLAIQTFLWWPEGACWRDYDVTTRQQVTSHSKSAAGWLPLYAQCLPAASAEMERSIRALESSGLLQPAGVLTTLEETGEQWTRPTPGHRCSTCSSRASSRAAPTEGGARAGARRGVARHQLRRVAADGLHAREVRRAHHRRERRRRRVHAADGLRLDEWCGAQAARHVRRRAGAGVGQSALRAAVRAERAAARMGGLR